MFKVSEQVSVWFRGFYWRGVIVRRHATTYDLKLVGWGLLNDVSPRYIVRS